MMDCKKYDKLQDVIKKIQEIIENREGSQIFIRIFTDNIFGIAIYDSEIPVIIDLKSKSVYLDTEAYNGKITSDMLDELSKIVRLLEKNIHLFESIIWENK